VDVPQKEGRNRVSVFSPSEAQTCERPGAEQQQVTLLCKYTNG
jgi:hypothetical protein